MKSLIIYCSDYKNNTEKIAKAFAEKLCSELVHVKNINNISVDTTKYDLIGFGSGVYGESMSPKIFKLVEKLDLQGKDVFVFSTSGVGSKLYNKKLINLLELKKAKNKGSFACKGMFIASEFTKNKVFGFFERLSENHPNEKDLKDAERFIGRFQIQI